MIMVAIAISQLNEARKERVAAKQALAQAEEAKGTALLAAEDANKVYETTRDLALTLTRIVYFQTITKREIGTARSKTAIENIGKELNRVIRKMMPDSEERKAFIRDLESDLPSKK